MIAKNFFSKILLSKSKLYILFNLLFHSFILIVPLFQSLFASKGITTDLNIKAPPILLEVKYPGNLRATGNVLTPTQVKEQPEVKWNAGKDDYYTLAMVDPDAKSRTDPQLREVKHW